MSNQIRKAVIPAAGRGTRLHPITQTISKEMLPVVDTPVIAYCLQEAFASGIDEVVVITAPHKKDLNSYLHKEKRVTCVMQKNPAGLGDAIYHAKKALHNAPFAVLLPDVVLTSARQLLSRMISQHQRYGGSMIAVQEVPRQATKHYGIIDGDTIGGSTILKVRKLVEKPTPRQAPSCLAILGRYILHPTIFDTLKASIHHHKKAKIQKEIQLTDALQDTLLTTPLHALQYRGDSYDCGTKAGLVTANLDFALKRQALKKEIQIHMKDIGKKLEKSV